jgi:hypothetical protein
MISSTRNCARKSGHTFERVRDMSFRRAQIVSENQIRYEVTFHEATLQSYDCGEAQLPTSTLGTDLLCGHRRSMEAIRPPLSRGIEVVKGKDMT